MRRVNCASTPLISHTVLAPTLFFAAESWASTFKNEALCLSPGAACHFF